MSATLKNINTHVVDILGSTKGRDQPIMKMDKAIDLVNCLEPEILESDDHIFFDPFCKAGELLLAIALLSCLKRKKQSVVSQKEVVEELYNSNRFFGMAPDERHYFLSLRTFYGNERSHNNRVVKNIINGNYLSENDGRLNESKFKKELEGMIDFIKKESKDKKIIAIGNPPYQEDYKNRSKNTGANPIYHIFLDALIRSKSINQFLMVVPSRWFLGGRGQSLRSFASNLKSSGCIKKIYDFKDARIVFPTVEIKGGVCYLYWSSDHKGETLFHSYDNDEKEYVDLRTSQNIIRDKLSRSIVRKIEDKSPRYISEIAHSWNLFGLSSNYFDKNNECSHGDLLECFTKRGIIKKIEKTKIKKGIDEIRTYKVACPKAVGRGGDTYRPDQVFIINKNQVCTETYIIIKCFDKKKDAESFLKYITTSFIRFMVSVKKITQDITKETWSLAPLLDDKMQSWPEKKVYKFFLLSEKEIAHIKSTISSYY